MMTGIVRGGVWLRLLVVVENGWVVICGCWFYWTALRRSRGPRCRRASKWFPLRVELGSGRLVAVIGGRSHVIRINSIAGIWEGEINWTRMRTIRRARSGLPAVLHLLVHSRSIGRFHRSSGRSKFLLVIRAWAGNCRRGRSHRKKWMISRCAVCARERRIKVRLVKKRHNEGDEDGKEVRIKEKKKKKIRKEAEDILGFIVLICKSFINLFFFFFFFDKKNKEIVDPL